MPRISGEVVLLGDEPFAHPVGAPVIAKQGSTPLGSTEVDEEHLFVIDIADDVRGEVVVELVLTGAAPATIEADGEDLEVTVVYNPNGKLYA